MTFILLLAVIFGIIGALTGCDAFEVETKTVIDYRYTEAHTEQYDRTDDNGNHYYNYVFVQEKYDSCGWRYTRTDTKRGTGEIAQDLNIRMQRMSWGHDFI